MNVEREVINQDRKGSAPKADPERHPQNECVLATVTTILTSMETLQTN